MNLIPSHAPFMAPSRMRVPQTMRVRLNVNDEGRGEVR